jgi:hypothetical protein
MAADNLIVRGLPPMRAPADAKARMILRFGMEAASSALAWSLLATRVEIDGIMAG